MILSVLIISFNQERTLARCLEALVAQADPEKIEALVVGREANAGKAHPMAGRFPGVIWSSTPPDENIPQMRSRGIARCRGEVIALLEDDCVVGEGWCNAVLAAHEQDQLAIGGAINPDDYERGVDWAVFFCEYARFMSPFAGHVSALPGNNVSYKRESLLAFLRDQASDDGFYDVFFHWQLQQEGELLIAEPSLAVTNVNRWQRTNVTRIPYHHGRGFAGKHSSDLPGWQRALLAGLSGPLPLLMIGRIIRELRRRRQYWPRFVFALPWVFSFAISWALGEMLGYLLGAGESKKMWR